MSASNDPATNRRRFNLPANAGALAITPALIVGLLAAAIYLVLKILAYFELIKRPRRDEPPAVVAAAVSPVDPPAPPVEPPEPPGVYVSGVGTILMMVYLMLFSGLLLYSLVQLWPYASTDGNPAATVIYFAGKFEIPNEMRLLLIVAIAGALGGLIHALRSFYWYVGNRILKRSWAPMYLMLPFVGSTLGLVFYLVIRGGFFSTQATVDQTSPFGFAALAGLVGMFSQQAVLKLKQVAETLLAKPEPGKDAKPQEKSAEPAESESKS
jgi:hypothetical protein